MSLGSNCKASAVSKPSPNETAKPEEQLQRKGSQNQRSPGLPGHRVLEKIKEKTREAFLLKEDLCHEEDLLTVKVQSFRSINFE